MEKLGDNKIAIRQLAQEALKALGYSIKPAVILGMLNPFLSSPNWHIREEILLYTITTFLNIGKSNGEELEELDYVALINSIGKLLDDDKPKVVQIVYETIATIANIGNRTKVMELLLELADQEIYRRLCDRVEAGALPIQKPEGGLDFPYLTFGLSTQNTFYSNTHTAFRTSTNSMLPNNQLQDEEDKKDRFTSAGRIKLNQPKYRKPENTTPVFFCQR